ncbi:MAG: 3-deoxy-7-phosphoheptulonate synthase class II [Bryobacter sp.]|nr:3-deoxy-7-phosphoheptulonate synthase class II [Bryobacter sp.]
MSSWTPSSWTAKPAAQQPNYPDASRLAIAQAELAVLPALVSPWEIAALEAQLAEAALGKRFLLQGGDCAESFTDCRHSIITNNLKILLQMSLVLVQGAELPVIRVGRFAGQYAKPRSEDMENRDGVTLPSYRGDLINRPGFTAEERTPDPDLMLRGYERAALTLNALRALARGGFADLHHPEYWDLDFMAHSPLAAEYRRIAGSVGQSLRFMENILGLRSPELGWVDFFTSHEGLLLPYEQAQTHRAGPRGAWYNLSTHFPWIGMRTTDPGGAHVEYFRGIANPIAVKIGPATTPEQLKQLLRILHPENRPGRLTLIHRFGREKIAEGLPPLLDAVREDGRAVLWCCDPMHGNTRTTAEGYKTRSFGDILAEVELAFDLHAAAGTRLGGIHVEVTGEDVTECTGGARGLSDQDLSRAYRTGVDPRLNGEQALELALIVSRRMQAARG